MIQLLLGVYFFLSRGDMKLINNFISGVLLPVMQLSQVCSTSSTGKDLRYHPNID